MQCVQRLGGVASLAEVLEYLEAGFQDRFHPFSNFEVEMATAVRFSSPSPGLLPVHLGAVGNFVTPEL